MAQRSLQGLFHFNRALSYVCNRREYYRMLWLRRELLTSRHRTTLQQPLYEQFFYQNKEPDCTCNAFVNFERKMYTNFVSSTLMNCSHFDDFLSFKNTRKYLTKNSTRFDDFLHRKFVRKYATKNKPKFTLENQLYKDYLQSLEDKYKSLLELRENSPHRFGHDENMNLQKLQPIIDIFQRVQQKYVELKELEVLARDKEMERMAETEIQDTLTVIKEMEEELVSSLTPPEKVDDCDIILEVECGAGGQESMLFADEIFKMYQALSVRMGWKFDTIGITETKIDRGGGTGFHSASASVSGYGVYQQMKYEGGVHRVQRVPTTEAKGRIHTSTVTVAILPQPKEIDIQIQKKDLQIESMRSSGPGGQNVQKVNSAVRIVHLPSGIVSECQETRSYFKNEELAMKKLKSRLYELQLKEQTHQTVSQRKIQVGNKDRSEKIRTYNFMQDRITDHRISHSVFNMPSFMAAGPGLTEIMEKLQEGARYEAIESKMEEYQRSLSQDKETIRKRR